MAYEIETKVLEINVENVVSKLVGLGAKKILDTRFVVDWFRMKVVKENEDPWFLRIRSDSDGKHEVTWKAKSEILGTARKHKEINFTVSDAAGVADLFTELDLEKYAHQEKDRISFLYENWRFDIDQYPNMPAFLEIEGASEESINTAINLLELGSHKTWAKGERLLIQELYGLNWYDMKF